VQDRNRELTLHACNKKTASSYHVRHGDVRDDILERPLRLELDGAIFRKVISVAQAVAPACARAAVADVEGACALASTCGLGAAVMTQLSER
jgi:hypothetical protein